MQTSCIGWEWESPTSDFKRRFQTMAGLVGKEDVFEKHKTSSFWNDLNFNNEKVIWVKEKNLASFLLENTRTIVFLYSDHFREMRR